jgi:hypothetical protein
MWLVGTIVLLIFGAALVVALGWTPRTPSGAPPWDITELNRANAGGAGTSAGFSLTAAIFIAGLDVARTSSEFATVFGMMLVGFLILVMASWIANSTPKRSEAEGTTALPLAVVLASTCGNLGVSITWLALEPLMVVIGVPALPDVFIWPLLIMVVAAGAWGALVTYYLTNANSRACLTIPVLGLALPALYRLMAVRGWPSLWPASDAALHFAFVALGVAGLLFALHMWLLVTHSNKGVQQRLRRGGHRIVLASNQVYAMMVALTWFAVAMP